MSHVDLNRCGVALMEIVSKPDMRSAEEARAFLMKLRSILRYLGTSDADMEKGNLRADLNVSVRRPGDAFGTPTQQIAHYLARHLYPMAALIRNHPSTSNSFSHNDVLDLNLPRRNASVALSVKNREADALARELAAVTGESGADRERAAAG
jgi:hypothetical protein